MWISAKNFLGAQALSLHIVSQKYILEFCVKLLTDFFLLFFLNQLTN